VKPLSKTLIRYACAVLIVIASSVVAELFHRLTGSARLSSIFLLGVSLTAFLLGAGPSYLATCLAFMVYLFLVDPRYQFTFGSPEDFDTLVVFVAVAALTGMLTGRVRDEAKRAKARARTTGALLEATRDFSASSDEQFIRDRMAHHLAAAARGAAIVHGGARLSCVPEDALTREVLTDAARLERDAQRLMFDTHTVGDWTLRALRDGALVLGVASWKAQDSPPLDPDEQTLLAVLADTGAAAIARARLAAGKAEAETRARTEDLRNALLSSISHDLRTPLAAIMASASSLQEFGEVFDAPTREDLAATIQEEAVRLDAFVANLLNMTRLESGAISTQRIAFSVPEVIARTVNRPGRNAPHGITVSLAPDLPEAMGDPVLFEQAFGNVFENALRYAPLQPIVVSACGADGGVRVEVRDCGAGVPPEDLERIFQKFFRSPASARTSGTGLGLSIARGLLEAMGGSIAAHNEDGSGFSVTINLPAAA
jgi:two-component system sensor histidine kinase KdpD